ncbi:YjbQ family protein [Candidatus Bathyarchaeota archaeon]|nr:YjbQ family protein [Candidatus Bathyarchaeota archaeon]
MGVNSGYFEFETRGEFDVVDITGRVEEVVRGSGIGEGIALVYAGHATGIIILNEYDHALLEDLRSFMRDTFPAGEDYRHPGNAEAHLRSMVFTPSRVIPVHGGRLGLGTWQSLYWVEAERRPRRRRVEVTVVGE